VHHVTGDAYRSWANCGLGSTVTTEETKEMAPGIRMITTVAMTLCALDPEKAVLDMVVRNRIDGGAFSFPPTEILQEVVIPAHPEPPEAEYSSSSESNEDGSWGIAEVSRVPFPPPSAEGDETLQIAGQSIPCRWTLGTNDVGGTRVTLKTWYSDRIPGGVARFETRIEGPAQTDPHVHGPSPQSSVSVVVSFLKK
jgi:hypothetical protein